MSQYNRFAYGYDTVDDCPCPALAAGFSPNSVDGSIEIAEEYDEILKEKYEKHEGTVTEEQAKAAWFEAIEVFEKKNDTYYHGTVEVGEQIARELGWE